ncbi:MAG: NAD(P)H-quinone oxidoreductase [Burkholderiaceae bacterium]
MRAITVENPGPASVLRYSEVPDPIPRAHDVIVRVRAAGVNRADLRFRQGDYGNASWGDSNLIGLEVAGDIVYVDALADAWRVGDRVMSIVGGGGYAQLARVDSRMLMRIPDSLGYVDAAAIPEAFITANEAVCHLGDLAPGERLLIHAAASGIGTAAIQLARVIDAQITATASATKLDSLRALGVDLCIDRCNEDFESLTRSFSNGLGMDVIIDFVGAPYLQRNLRALADGGRLVLAGLLGGIDNASIPIERFILGHLKMFGTVMKSRTLEEKCEMTKRFSDRWLPAFDTGLLRPVVDSVHPVFAAEEAHRRIAANKSFGKIILEI